VKGAMTSQQLLAWSKRNGNARQAYRARKRGSALAAAFLCASAGLAASLAWWLR